MTLDILPTPPSAAALENRLAGHVLRPSDPWYDEARSVFNGMIDRRPALIARCVSEQDVVEALRFGLESGLPLAVRGGGHSAAGYCVVDGGLVIDLSQMKRVLIDAEGRTVRLTAGLTWGELDEATQAHGLAVTGGRASSTGVVGFTLASGSGWLERKLGLAADSLVSARVVTATGEAVTASEDTLPELFWAIRGGGGNFGIVTELEFRLHPVGPMVLGGAMLFSFDRAGEIVRAYRELIESAGDDLCGGLSLRYAPPAPFVPPHLRGQMAVAVVVLWTGDHAEGERAIAPLRSLGPDVDVVARMPYTQLQKMTDDGNPWGVRCYYKSGFMREMTDEAVDTIVARASSIPSPMSNIILQPLGGAFARVPEDATALGRRDARWAFQVLSMWRDPSGDEAQVGWTRCTAASMQAYAADAAFPNFIADHDDELVRRAYGAERYARLVAVKNVYDPANVFSRNHNIRPSVG
jgi:FAD/FMN-containing dehydrogenase